MSNQPYCAVVTGASRGIGRAIARRLAAAGLPVAALSRTLCPGSGQLAGSLEETVATIVADGGTAQAFAADLGDVALDRADLVARVEESMGVPVGILVNNAAAARHYDVPFTDMRREWFQDTVEINLWNTWAMMGAVVPSMRRLATGWILNTSSRQAGPRVGPPFAPHPLAGSALYGGSKAFLDRLSTGAAMELYDDGIAVNAVAPNRGWPPSTPRAPCRAGPRTRRRRSPRQRCCSARRIRPGSPGGSPTASRCSRSSTYRSTPSTAGR